jgi:hypothetical protein
MCSMEVVIIGFIVILICFYDEVWKCYRADEKFILGRCKYATDAVWKRYWADVKVLLSRFKYATGPV